jgi:hypothetical protein
VLGYGEKGTFALTEKQMRSTGKHILCEISTWKLPSLVQKDIVDPLMENKALFAPFGPEKGLRIWN